MTYTKEFLISKLHRFYDENSRVPTMLDMQGKFGYPSIQAYKTHFKTWNNALKVANLLLNRYHPKLDGTETCSYCGKRADEILNFEAWRYIDNERYCGQHGQNPDYVNGNLDINSSKGLGRAGEILIIKTLKIDNRHDCNRESCHAEIDMYHKDYGRIDVKTSLLSYKYNCWTFTFYAKKEANVYICLGMSTDRKTLEHVWIVPNEGEIRHQQSLTITNSYNSLSNRNHWEVLSKPYNDMWQTMKLNNCKIMVDKSKVI